ncbi:hypothetical protein XHV734_4946 [Xanthomonas hortorum pv. vitians]|nr:hypothetical protein XHV734_4946 [Xanthomonas hortorum pv. vitians]
MLRLLPETRHRSADFVFLAVPAVVASRSRFTTPSTNLTRQSLHWFALYPWEGESHEDSPHRLHPART